uniref:Uncharacterized protein n=1 Tax=Ciona savignyi TaxID=51511 RepID=H2Z2Q5_CIOSA
HIGLSLGLPDIETGCLFTDLIKGVALLVRAFFTLLPCIESR